MAVKATNLPDYMRQSSATLAGILCMVLALAGAAAVSVNLLGGKLATESMLLQCGLLVLFALNLVAGVQLLKGCPWSHRLLLAFWLVMSILAVSVLLSAVLWGSPSWWTWLVAAPLPAVALSVLAAGAVASGLLISASAGGSRLRYGSMVMVSIAAAIVLALVVNMIAQKDPYHKDLESLGQYGISERTKRIVGGINQPVQLTAVYMSTDEKRKGSDFRAATVELLQEIQQEAARQGKQVKVVNVTSDGERAKVLQRLRQQVIAGAKEHNKLIADFLAGSQDMLKTLQTMQEKWSGLDEQSYLNYWGLSTAVPSQISQAIEQLDKTRTDVQRATAGSSLPDMPKLVEGISKTLESLNASFSKGNDTLDKIAKMPTAIAANKAGVMKAMTDAMAAAQNVLKELPAKNAKVDDTTALLKKIAASATKASQAFEAAGEKLSDVAGPDQADLLQRCNPWSIRSEESGLPFDLALPQLVQSTSGQLGSAASDAMLATANLKLERQEQILKKIVQELAPLPKIMEMQQKRISEALDKLSKVDEPSKQILAQAADKKAFAAILDPVKMLQGQIAKLPALKSSSLGEDLAAENVVLAETGDKAEVVSFDQIWPRRSQSPAARGENNEEKRVFNGDSAVGSKILAMTHKPFGTAILTYYQPKPPKEAQQEERQIVSRFFGQVIAPEELGVLRKRIEESNFKVVDWNLAEEKPKEMTEAASSATTQGAAPEAKTPVVLIILPPPQTPSPQMLPPQLMGMMAKYLYGPQYEKKVTDEIAAGTPALFLETFVGPRPFMIQQVQSGYQPYLKDSWGIDVMNSYRLVGSVRDETTPGQYRLSVNSFYYLPLSDFSDHPIGKPLQAQRMLWNEVVPVRIMSMAEIAKNAQAASQPTSDVVARPLLTAPARASEIWATANVRELVSKMKTAEGGLVKPQFDTEKDPDLKTPIDVAVAATQTMPSGVKERIVVMGVGGSFSDVYLTEEILSFGAKGAIQTAPPPKADMDFVVNSLYWLINQPQFIAAGPAVIKPIELLSPEKTTLLQVGVIGGLPVLVLIIGLVVWTVRRK